MIEIFKRCMTTDFANFGGRARRREYWLFALASGIISFILAVLPSLVEGSAVLGSLVGLVSLIVGVAMFIPSIAVGVRRLHDTGRSGLWYLIGFIPFIGGIVLFVFALLDGDKGENKYGPDPKAGEAA